MVDENACLMKGEKELVMGEGIDGRGQRRGEEAKQKSLFYVMVILLLDLM